MVEPTPMRAGPGTFSLRVSITDRCDLACAYCVPEGRRAAAGPPLLPLEELARLTVGVARAFPVERVRVTGGEPLLRPGVERFVAVLAHAPEIPEIAMTTNGTRLGDHARVLAGAGLDRVNVSLDTLDDDRYRRLTGRAALGRVLAGIDAALNVGIAVKVNAVLRRSGWREDVPALLDWSATTGLEVRFLELMRTGTSPDWCDRELVGTDEVLAWLRTRTDVGPVVDRGTAPARRTRVSWRGRSLDVGWIAPVSSPFCDRCNRLRLDPRGRLRRCLMDPATVDCGSAPGELAAFVAGKRPPEGMDTPLPMVALGG